MRPKSDLQAIIDQHLEKLRSSALIYGMIQRNLGKAAVEMYKVARLPEKGREGPRD